MSRTSRFALAIALVLGAGTAHAAPLIFTYSGFLTDSSGTPITSSSTLIFRFYDADVGGNMVGSETIANVLPNSPDGFFSVVVGTGYSPAPTIGVPFDLLFASQVWMTVQFQGDAGEMLPRIPLTSVPSAVTASSADTVPWAGVTGFPSSSCSGATPYVTGVASNGAVACGTAPPGTGTVTSVGASAPIASSGGAAPTISITQASGAANGYLSSIDWTTFNNKQGRTIAPTCAIGSYVRSIAADGTPTCAVDANSGGTITGVTAGTGLSGGGTSGTVALSLNPAAAPTFAGLTVTGTVSAGLEWVIVSNTAPSSGASPHYAGATAYLYMTTATCPTGKRVLGGGCDVTGNWVANSHIGISRPSGEGWNCYATSNASVGVTANAYAICARIGP